MELSLTGAAAPRIPSDPAVADAPVTPLFAGDLELARRVAAGEDAAFDRVYEENVERVYALCLRMCGDPDKARRLTQDAFVRAWERIGSFRGESRLSSWLHRVTANVVVESRRRRSRWRLRLVEEPQGGERVPAPKRRDPGLRLDLERAIASLPEGARTVLVLRDVEGYSYEEITRITGLAMGTVKAQIHRARKLMQERLER